MYTKNPMQKTSIKVNTSYEGETIEKKMRRIMTSKEPISDEAPLIYTERKDGVRPEYNIRTDRFEIAVEAMDYVTRSEVAKREQRIGDRAFENMNEEAKTEHIKKYPHSKHKDWKPKNGGPESTQTT